MRSSSQFINPPPKMLKKRCISKITPKITPKPGSPQATRGKKCPTPRPEPPELPCSPDCPRRSRLDPARRRAPYGRCGGCGRRDLDFGDSGMVGDIRSFLKVIHSLKTRSFTLEMPVSKFSRGLFWGILLLVSGRVGIIYSSHSPLRCDCCVQCTQIRCGPPLPRMPVASTGLVRDSRD